MNADPALRLDRTTRKAGGVYYTPRWLAGYMVERALGPVLAGASREQIEGLRILDPACGAGVFLVSAFERLLGAGDDAAKRRLLESNLYGLDLDEEAIAAAKRELSLAAGGELPTRNLRCGNALVDSSHDLIAGRGGEHAARLRPFDWSDPVDGFGEVLSEGGFDVILGNPPYRRERGWKAQLEEIGQSDFGRRHKRPRMDLWFYFLHRSLGLLKPGGRLCFVVNAYWTSSGGAEAIVDALERECHVEELLPIGGETVFEGVSGQHLVLLLSKGKTGEATRIRRARTGVPLRAALAEPGRLLEWSKTPEELFRPGGLDLEPPAAALLARIDRGTPLEGLGEIRQGIAENPARINRRTSERFGGRYRIGEGVFVLLPEELEALGLTDAELRLARPYHVASNLGRYRLRPPSSRLLWLTGETCPDIAAFPGIERHLARFRPILEERRETRNGARAWWQLHWPREPSLWTRDKMVALQMAPRPSFAFARGECLVPFSVNVFVPDAGIPESPYFLLGVLNSRLMWKWFRHRAKRRGVDLDLGGEVLRRAPIVRIDFADGRSRGLHDRIAAMAEALSTRLDETLERELDEAVCELYGVGEGERMVLDAGLSEGA